MHRKSREAAEALRHIEQRTGRDARDAEVAEAMSISMEEYQQILRESTTARVFSFDQPEDSSGEQLSLPQDDGATPYELVQQDAFQGSLSEAISNLPERERLVMSFYYDDELNLREIGEILGVSESRVCQIHGQALVRLRARLTDWVSPSE